jgi:hypothetical protein
MESKVDLVRDCLDKMSNQQMAKTFKDKGLKHITLSGNNLLMVYLSTPNIIPEVEVVKAIISIGINVNQSNK